MFHWLTTMYSRELSLLLWEAVAIQIDLAQLGFPYHTTYVGSRPTYINIHLDPPKCELVYATQEYSAPPPWAAPGGFIGCVHATLTISHAQCVVVFSHNGIAEVSGLPEYVTSTTKSRSQQVYNERSLTDTGGALRQDSILDTRKESTRSQIKFMIIIKPQDQPWV